MATGTNPFSKIVSTRQAETAKTAAEVQAAADRNAQDGREGHETGFIRPPDAAASNAALAGHQAGTATAAATPVQAAAAGALHNATEARLTQLGQEELRDGQHTTTAHTPDNTPAPQTPAGAPPAGGSRDGDPQHHPGADLTSALADAEARAHADLGRLEQAGELQQHDPSGGSGGPQSPGDRLSHGEDGKFSPETTQQAASQDPNDHGQGAAAFASLESSLTAQLTGNHGVDPVTAALEGLVTEGAAHDTSPLNVADGVDPNSTLGKAMHDVYGDPPKDPDAGKSTNVSLISKGEAGAPGANATYYDKDKGEVVNADQVTDAAKAAAAKEMTTTSATNTNKIEDGHSTTEEKTTIFNFIGNALADSKYQKEFGATDKQAADLRAARVASDAHKAGGGAGLTDPNSDDHPPTPAQIAFGQAIAQLEHIGPAFHNPGNVDPGPEGDQSGLQTGPASAATVAEHTGVRGGESLFGNPTGAGPEGGTASGHLNGSLTGSGHGGGEPNDAQGGVVQDDGNAPRGSVHETGPGGEHFGPSDSLGATPPSSSNDSGSGNDDGSGVQHLSLDPALVAEIEALHLPEHLASSDDD